MKCYLAPMEGITGYIYRNAQHRFFKGVDQYFTAFIAPNQRGRLSTREKNDILPEHNKGIHLIPQILTNCAEDFILTAQKIGEYGYSEVNLNLGCPSRTVVSKYRGSGFLAKPDMLDRFLQDVFAGTKLRISIKTRIGMEEPEEFERLLHIYNQYPITELIIHPRTQADYYKNKPNLSVFSEAAAHSKAPVCYNGDIFTAADYQVWKQQFPHIETVMAGRGLLINPGLIDTIAGYGMPKKDQLLAFHNQIYEEYIQEMSGEKPVLFKMKELWFYMIRIFGQPKKYAKRIKKAERLAAYEEAVAALFEEQNIVEDYGFL